MRLSGMSISWSLSRQSRTGIPLYEATYEVHNFVFQPAGFHVATDHKNLPAIISTDPLSRSSMLLSPNDLIHLSTQLLHFPFISAALLHKPPPRFLNN